MPSSPPIPLVRRSGVDLLTGAGLVWSSTQERSDLVSAALRLRDEQLMARVVYFAPEQPTNAELDKITEGVIAELRALRTVREAQRPSVGMTASEREIDLMAAMRQRLEQVLDPKGGAFLKAKLDLLSRRVTTLFFERTLGHNATPEELAARTVSLPEEGMYYALLRSRVRLESDVRSLKYESPEVLEGALERLSRVEKDLQIAYLGRRAPELEHLLPLVLTVFGEFFKDTFRRNVGDFCWQVVRGSGVSRAPEEGVAIYKIGPRSFPKFRETFERVFLEHFLLGVQDPLVARLQKSKVKFSAETLAFVSDPQVFSVVCGVMCDAFYDHLHSEGILDLPPGWRARTE
jgi:hypothetical protein